MNLKKMIGSFLILMCFACTFAYSQPDQQTATQPAQPYQFNDADNLRAAMSKLWEDHITWTRNYIISALANLGDLDAVTKRLLQNQVDIGNAIIPFYGNDAGNKLSALLKEHILLAAKVVKDAKNNNTKELKKSQQEWQKNAVDIANFLSNANPNWPKDQVQEMLNKHLELTTGEVTSRLKKDWTADIGYYDSNHDHMLKFSDMLTIGIIQQFPNKFNNA